MADDTRIHLDSSVALRHDQPLTEREEARERLRASVDALAQQANLQVQMQKEPLKMLGGASAVGALIGMVVGRQFRRSRRIYVDAGSPVKHQKALIKAQKQQGGKGVGGALVATLGTLAVKTLTERVITPKLEELSHSLLDKAGQPRPAQPASDHRVTTLRPTPPAVSSVAAGSSAAAPVSQGGAAGVSPVSSFLKVPEGAHPGVRPMPESRVEAKAVGSSIAADERANPNAR